MTNRSEVERVRATISVEPDVYQIFQEMAQTGGMSVSRCIGEWLADTVDGAQYVTAKMAEARRSPRSVMSSLHSGVHQGQPKGDLARHTKSARVIGILPPVRKARR